MLFTLIKNEFLKEKRDLLIVLMLLLPVGIAILLSFDFLIRYESWLLPRAQEMGISSWTVLIKEQRILYFNDYMPLFAAIIIGQLFETEYKNNGWTLALTKPVKRWQILLSKYITALIILTMVLIINIVALIIVGKIFKFPEAIPYGFFIKMITIQSIASAAVMAIHLFFSISSKNILNSFGIAAVLSILSSKLYYYGSEIMYYNPYSFSLFSITQNSNEILPTLAVSTSVILIGAVIVCKYFNNKKVY